MGSAAAAQIAAMRPSEYCGSAASSVGSHRVDAESELVR